MWNEPIHVLGAGSIGLLWTASIRSKFPTYPITLLLRDHDRNRNRVANAVAAAGGGGAFGSSGGTDVRASAHDSRDRDHRIDISWNNRSLAPAKNDSDEQTSASTPTPTPQPILSLPVQFINDSNHEQEPIKTLIVTTKAHQAKQAVESVLDRLLLPAVTDGNSGSASSCSSPTQIILLCNGALSVRDELSKILTPQTPGTTDHPISLALATTTHGAYLSEPHRLVHAGVGMTFLEQQQQQQKQPMDNNNNTNSMAHLWNQAGLNCTSLPSQQMNSILWNKLAANCVINPLTSIFRCTNGELLLEPSFPELKEDILNEVAGVAAGMAEITNAVGGDDAKNSSVVPTIDEMRTFVAQTIRDTHNNRSSMYQDIIIGHQPQTEIGHLNGYVVRKGKEMGKDCPANEEMCSRIAELSIQNSNRNR